jgi:hypothetical protein
VTTALKSYRYTHGRDAAFAAIGLVAFVVTFSNMAASVEPLHLILWTAATLGATMCTFYGLLSDHRMLPDTGWLLLHGQRVARSATRAWVSAHLSAVSTVLGAVAVVVGAAMMVSGWILAIVATTGPMAIGAITLWGFGAVALVAGVLTLADVICHG